VAVVAIGGMRGATVASPARPVAFGSECSATQVRDVRQLNSHAIAWHPPFLKWLHYYSIEGR
jgi:hypothetical protein